MSLERSRRPPDQMTPTNQICREKKYHKWNLGTINIQTCSEDIKLHMTLQDCIKANLDIVCFQEVRRTKKDNVKHLGYTFYWSGLQVQKSYGVGIAIKNTPSITIDCIHYISARIMAADVTIKGCKLRIISCYAPARDNSLSSKQTF